MIDLICYKTLPVWNNASIPQMFQEKHNTKAGTWAKLTILMGKLKFYVLSETGEVLSTTIFDVDNQPPFIDPQCWHKVEPLSGDLSCQLSFYCRSEDFYAKKYDLTVPHSEVLNAVNYIQKGRVLDLGCGRGRNTLYLNSLGFEVVAVDHNEKGIEFLNYVIEKEQLTGITTAVYDINQASLKAQYDFIISTVVLMFLNRDRIPMIIENMQQSTKVGGYNLIVAAMDTDDYPCYVPFSFTLKSNQLKAYYRGWEFVKYNEEVGQLHKTDEKGNRITLRFATMLAKKITD